jgi:enoyl-CoA hydratase/carnithine racemase
MSLIQIERRDSVAILILNRGVTNPWNLKLVNALRDTLLEVNDDQSVRGVVLTGNSDKFFSIGFDIPELFPLHREGFEEFYRSYNRLCLELYTFLKPTIAAITGHAVAGGCIVTMCCDYRFIAEGRKLMGVNEIKIGVPIPYPASCIMHELVGFRINRDLNDFGEYYPADELLKMGVVDKVLPLEQVLPEAVEQVRKIGAFSSKAFALIKRNRTEAVANHIREHLEEREQHFIDCWFSDEARPLLEEAMKKF